MADDGRFLLSSNAIRIILETLAKRGAGASCPMCGSLGAFELANGYLIHRIYEDPSIETQDFASRQLVPLVALICGNCGFVSQHALGTLGLMHLISQADSSQEDAR